MPSFFELRLPVGELDVQLCVTSGQVFRWEPVAGDEWLGVDGQNWFRVVAGTGPLAVEGSAGEVEFRKLFGLETPFEVLRKRLLERGPELGPYIESLPGLRLMKPTDPNEVFFCFLCTANNHLARIHGMVRALAAYGEPLAEVDGRLLTRFPTAERIAKIPEQELRAKGFGYRAKSIPIAAARLAERGEGWLKNLTAKPLQEARASLLEIPSIGPKLADCIALYGLHKNEATPFDTHLWQAYCRVYQPSLLGQILTGRRYDEASAFLRERFGDLAGLAHLFLYRENQLNWRKRE